MTRAEAEVGLLDTSVFIARESGRTILRLPERVALSVITIGELQLGVLNAGDAATRSRRADTLALARAADPIPISEAVMVSWARLVADCRAAACSTTWGIRQPRSSRPSKNTRAGLCCSTIACASPAIMMPREPAPLPAGLRSADWPSRTMTSGSDPAAHASMAPSISPATKSQGSDPPVDDFLSCKTRTRPVDAPPRGGRDMAEDRRDPRPGTPLHLEVRRLRAGSVATRSRR